MEKNADKNNNQSLPVYEAELISEIDEDSKAVEKKSTAVSSNFSQTLVKAASFIVAGFEVFRKIKDVFGYQNSDRKGRAEKGGKRIRQRRKGKG